MSDATASTDPAFRILCIDRNRLTRPTVGDKTTTSANRKARTLMLPSWPPQGRLKWGDLQGSAVPSVLSSRCLRGCLRQKFYPILNQDLNSPRARINSSYTAPGWHLSAFRRALVLYPPSGLRFRGQLTLSPARLDGGQGGVAALLPVGLLHPLRHAAYPGALRVAASARHRSHRSKSKRGLWPCCDRCDPQQ